MSTGAHGALDSIEIAVYGDTPPEGTPEYEAFFDDLNEALQMGAEAVANAVRAKFPQLTVRVDGLPSH